MKSYSPQSCMFLPYLLFSGGKRGGRFSVHATGGISVHVVSVMRRALVYGVGSQWLPPGCL